VVPLLRQSYISTSHLNLTHAIEFSDDGTRAAGETYALAVLSRASGRRAERARSSINMR